MTQMQQQTATDHPVQTRGAGEWHGAWTKAKADVARLTNEQKASLATCIGWEKGPGMANIAPIKEIDFPGLTLQDGPGGIRFTDHASAFPAQINAAATWDKELCRRRGEALGAEARGKGCHVLLAPTMNMGRVPCGGRNFESSGADPYLTGEVAYEIIKGIQSKGVQAVAKHFICNEQEHFRESSSSNVDERTLHTIYMHPFLRSVQAGVASVMSSYNQLNGTWTSEHDGLLNKILKHDMDFQGYVMSDWWSQRSGIPSAIGGLDMTCPGEDVYGGKDTYYGPHLVKAVETGELPQCRLDDMAIRILSAYYLLKQDENFPATNFNSWNLLDEATNQHVDVAADHGSLIREMGAASIVLLKNDGILPLIGSKQPRTLAVIGSCAGDSPLGPNQSGSGGPNIRIGETAKATPGVAAMGWGSATANFPYLISPLTAIQSHAKEHKIPLEWHLDNDNIERVHEIARPAKVAIVFISASSGEGYITVEGNFGDRNNMEAWGNGSALVKAVAEVNENVVVVIHSVGPILLEEFIEHPNVKACLYAGCLGQEAGNAVSDVLFGKTNPSGRLPFTIAKSPDDYGTKLIYKKAGDEEIVQIDYKEGLFIDYRYLQQQGIRPRYAFGHGLSYSAFTYQNLKVTSHSKVGDIAAHERDGTGNLTRLALHKTCVSVDVDITNESGPAGKEIVQLYLEFPKSASEAPLVLRGFEAVHLGVGQKRTVSFGLSRYSLSCWSTESKFWQLAKGDFVVKVGASSEDIRLSGKLQL